MAARCRFQFCSISLLHFSLLIGAEAQVVLRLDIEPQVEALCPGDQLQLSCWHNATHNDPDWRVTNGSNEIFRAIDFQGSSLQGHTLINSTTVLEVLQIGPIQIAFNGLRYSCLYNTFSGERRSNEVMVKLHEPPSIRDLTARSLDSTTVAISWEQDEDACRQSTTPLLLITSSNITRSVGADCNQQQSRYECLVPGLIPDTQYTLDVYITTDDGRRSTTAASVSFETVTLVGGTQSSSNSGVVSLCTTEPLACGLYGLTGAIGAMLLLTVGISISVFVKWSCERKGTYETKGQAPGGV